MSQLKEQDGKYYQQCKVVMLATKQGRLVKNKNGILLADVELVHKSGLNSPQHLYILSDEEIEEEDIILMPCAIGRVKEIRYEDGNKRRSLICEDLISLSLRYGQKENQLQTNSFLVTDCTKIIATTNISLGLPQPSQSFIKKYVEEYNKGLVIENVLVERWADYIDREYDTIGELAIDKDNTITIKKIKDSYSREEVINIFNKYNEELLDATVDFSYMKLKIWKENWIKQNLK